jgi:hypothetical protein
MRVVLSTAIVVAALAASAIALVGGPAPRPAPSIESITQPRPPSGARAMAAAASVTAPSRAVAHDAGLHQRVARWLKGNTPREHYRAFGVLAQCAHAIDFDRYLHALPASSDTGRLRERYGDGAARIAAACDDLSQRDVELRIELAARAADDGVPGAASAWIEEGPYGDRTALLQRPDDPLVVEWAQQAIARVLAATRRADTEAIGQFGLLCLNWELDDVARVRLLVDDALERRREDQIQRLLN